MKLKSLLRKEKGRIQLKKGWKFASPKLYEKALQAWTKYTKDWSAWGPRSVVRVGYRPVVMAVYGDLAIEYSVSPKLFGNPKDAQQRAKEMLDAAIQHTTGKLPGDNNASRS